MIVFIILLTALAISASPSPYRRVCYYFDPAGLPVSYLNLTVCTHLIYFGVGYNENTNMFHWPKPIDASAVANLTALKKTYNFKVIAGKIGDLKQVCGSQNNMTKFAKSALSFFQQNNLDGIDFDWEFPLIRWKEPFARLLQIVRKTFNDAGETTMSISVAASGDSLIIVDSYNVSSLAKSIDFLSIMVSVGWQLLLHILLVHYLLRVTIYGIGLWDFLSQLITLIYTQPNTTGLFHI